MESPDNFILCDILKDLKENKIVDVVDDNGLTLLHHAVLKGVEGKVELLVDFAKNFQKLKDEEIIDWINAVT